MSRFLNKRYQSLEAYTPGEQPRDMVYIKLNTNESPYPPAPSVVAEMDETQVENLRLYSDPTGLSLKQKLAELYDLKVENIFISNGSDDILNFAFMAFADERGAAFADITYGFYPVYGELHNVNVQIIPLEADFSLDYKKYCGINKMIVIANPNAPTGMEIPLWQIEEILKSNPDSVVVVDEAYVDFGGTSCYKLIKNYVNLLVVRTFSKSRCMAGARLGYAFGDVALIEDLEKLKYSTNPYNVNRLTMLLGCATVDAEPYYREVSEKIQSARAWSVDALQKLGFEVLPSKANFIFARHPAVSGAELYSELRRRGILVRHFTKERIKDFIRITIGTQEQMEHLANALQDMTGGT
ncbi:MAG: histidinol-phosphate transaminase [Oscillospiraceae bacterium]|nr:histidinol-phosphate transaminase [Oscillospiraceae bacterium]